MRKRTGGDGRLMALGIALVLAAAPSSASETKLRQFSAGVDFDYFSRTVGWEGEAEKSRVQASLISARAEFGLGKGLTFSLAVGLSLSEFKSLIFDGLPISLEFDASAPKGIALRAEVVAPFVKLGNFEIGAAGRFVYSYGLARTWPIEDFAVEGEATGRASWMEASGGPRLVYNVSGRIVPYVEVAARWLKVDFRMDETLDDLEGTETKRIKGDVSFSVSIGGDIIVSDRLTVRGKAGFLPYPGGVDGMASVGLVYSF